MTIGSEPTPATRTTDGIAEVAGVVFAGSEHAVTLSINGDRVTAIEPAESAPLWLCLPPLADLHVHANRAYTPPAVRPVGLEDAARNVQHIFCSFSEDDYYRQACSLIDASRRRATTAIRTHADVSAKVGTEAVAGSLRAAAAFADTVDVEVVAFSGSDSDPATRHGRELLRECVDLGAHFLGGVPAFCSDPKANIDALLDLAAELAVPVDLHLDEHLDAARCLSGYLADATIERGLEGRVTLSHGCAIASLTSAARAQVIDRLAAAQITVIVLPRTNLYLQDFGDHTPTVRGVTPVREMIAADVGVRFASDNVRDAFYPYGDADLLGVAMDGVLATHLDDPASVVAAICDGRHRLQAGDVADMVLLPGDSVDTVLAETPVERWVVSAGRFNRVDQPD